eukprot:8235425-Pyramimonas_sp.AAC.1
MWSGANTGCAVPAAHGGPVRARSGGGRLSVQPRESARHQRAVDPARLHQVHPAAAQPPRRCPRAGALRVFKRSLLPSFRSRP